MSPAGADFDLSTPDLATRCADATARRDDDGSCYELLRRALVERHDDAWQAVYRQYERLVRAWVVRHPGFATLSPPNGDAEHLANAVFARFWQNLPPERFHEFPSVAALMAFLRRCTNSVVIEAARRAARRARREQRLERAENLASDPPAMPALSDEARAQLWALANAVAQDERDLVVLELSYRNDLRPAAIAARRPDLFPTVTEVYRCKRNLLDRLRRNPEVLALAREASS